MTIAYIDGFNLYYGLLQKMPQYKWLDPLALVRELLRKEHELVGVKFFTARIRPYPFDAAAINRHFWQTHFAMRPIVSCLCRVIPITSHQSISYVLN